MEIKERILQKAEELFFRYGIRSVTMDDIAQELGISKKTIYQNFEDKDAIVHEIVRVEMDCEIADSERINDESSNAIEAVFKETELFQKNVAIINPTLVYDLKKYHPKTWELFREHKNGILLSMVMQNLQRGIREGLYRPEINTEILALLRLEEIELAFDVTIFPPNKFSQIEVHTTFIDHFLRGVLTPKGFELYHSIIENNKSNI